MARCGLISKVLATVDPTTCPGCSYGKAHYRPWRHKGIRNLKHIRQATALGKVVSVDQPISPTLYFVPTARPPYYETLHLCHRLHWPFF